MFVALNQNYNCACGKRLLREHFQFGFFGNFGISGNPVVPL
jgi:hypothetical protein